MSEPNAKAKVFLTEIYDHAPLLFEQWNDFLELKAGKVVTAPGSNPVLDLAVARMKSYSGKPDDEIDFDTIKRALRDPDWPTMWITPNSPPDIRHLRSYFLVPLMEVAQVGEQTLLIDEIKSYVKATDVNEVFVISHGWHRNYFGAVSVYDRLLSRFGILASRGRIPRPDNFRPLFIALHWHSDPGENGWVDPAGRRHRDSFLDAVRRLFVPIPSLQVSPQQLEVDFLTDFENLFVAMARLSAVDDRVDSSLLGQIPGYSQCLSKYEIKGCTSALGAPGSPQEMAAKISTVWRCYVEAESRSLVMDQDQAPKAFGNFKDALSTLFKFIVPVAGIGALIRFVPINRLLPWLTEQARGIGRLFGVEGDLQVPVGFAYVVFSIAAFSIGLLYLIRIFQGETRMDPKAPRSRKNGRSATGIPLLQAAAWLPLQLIATLPILIYLLVTWLFQTPLAFLALALFFLPPEMDFLGNWLREQFPKAPIPFHAALPILALVLAMLLGLTRLRGSLFTERLRHRGDRASNARDYLAAIARFPINLVKGTIGEDSALRAMAGAIENQIAFFEYQRKGVDAGQDAAYFIRDLVREEPRLENAKFHFIGHSFGALVVMNAVRELLAPLPKRDKVSRRSGKGSSLRGLHNIIRGQRFPRRGADFPKITVQSLTVLQAALASNWLEPELEPSNARPAGAAPWPERVQGSIACVFSKYDTAVGFFYPLANNSRYGAGNVGFKVDYAPILGHDGEFVMMNEPPSLSAKIPRKAGQAPIVNLDASRLVYQGPPASGGGHTDIFKDDIIHLIWAVTREPSSAGAGRLEVPGAQALLSDVGIATDTAAKSSGSLAVDGRDVTR